MKIKYDPPSTSRRILSSIVLGFVIFAIVWFNLYLHSFLAESEESITNSRGLNVTHNLPLLYCHDVPYDDCLCSVLSNKSHSSEKCITHIVLLGSRILPFISFFLQICLVRELFSLSEDHRRVIIYALGVISTFIFVGMKTGIYWNACYHLYITTALYLTGASLCFLNFHNALVISNRVRSISNRNQVIIPHRSETTNNNESRSWLELL